MKSSDGIHGNGSRRPYRLHETSCNVISITAVDARRAEPSKVQKTSAVLPASADRGHEEQPDSEKKQNGAARFVLLVLGR